MFYLCFVYTLFLIIDNNGQLKNNTIAIIELFFINKTDNDNYCSVSKEMQCTHLI